MTQEEQYCVSSLERKANAIFGFVVIQSILLANNMTHFDFMEKVQLSHLLYNYLLMAHAVIVVAAVISEILIGIRINHYLGHLKRELFSSQSTIVKAILILMFGVIPTKYSGTRLDFLHTRKLIRHRQSEWGAE